MAVVKEFSWDKINILAGRLAMKIAQTKQSTNHAPAVYGIPSGGIPVAQAVAQHTSITLVEKPSDADFFVDDIVDSGATRDRYKKSHPGIPFLSLIDKTDTEEFDDVWISFPWERMTNETSVEQNIVRILQYIGEDPEREGLRETPSRVVASYAELFGGYRYDNEDVGKLLKVFNDGACDEMVVVKDIEFVSFCEHHMLPFMGRVHIGYIPDGRVVGLSKLARLVEVYSRRLQIQERLTQQITTALDTHLKPLGSACVVSASHSCMTCRGVNKQHSRMITSSLTGPFRKDPAARAEFMAMVR